MATPLRLAIEQIYGRRSVYVCSNFGKDLDRFKNMSVAERSRYQVLSGHVPFGAHTLFPRPALTITFLRDDTIFESGRDVQSAAVVMPNGFVTVSDSSFSRRSLVVSSSTSAKQPAASSARASASSASAFSALRPCAL